MDNLDRARIAHLLDVLGIDLGGLKRGRGKIVLIAGDSCAGKTSMARRIINHAPQFRILNTGDFFREEAKKLNLSLGELIKASDEDLMKLDKSVDARIIKHLVETDETLVVTSHLAAPLAQILRLAGKSPLIISLLVDKNEKISRMSHREFGKGSFEISEEETEKMNEELKRDERDLERYEKVYNLDPRSFYRYSCVVDTSDLNEREVWKKVMELVDDYIIGGLKVEGEFSEVEDYSRLLGLSSAV